MRDPESHVELAQIPAPLSIPLQGEVESFLMDAFFPEGTRVEDGPSEILDRRLAIPERRYVFPSGRSLAIPAQTEHVPASASRHLLMRTGPRLIGHSRVFQRTVHTDRGPIRLRGLADLAIDEEFHGHGLGKRLALRSFADVDCDNAEGVILQTMIPDFFVKLGCSVVHNRFVNRRTALDPMASPWWSQYVLIYPAALDWPDGVIDLNGPGF